MGRKKPRRPSMTPEEGRELWKSLISANTDLMRLSDHPWWVRLRRQVEAQGVDPYTAVFVDSELRYPVFDEDDSSYRDEFEDGFIVTADGRVHHYRFAWKATCWEEAIFTQWTDITDIWSNLTTHFQGSPNRTMVALALEVLAAEQ